MQFRRGQPVDDASRPRQRGAGLAPARGGVAAGDRRGRDPTAGARLPSTPGGCRPSWGSRAAPSSVCSSSSTAGGSSCRGRARGSYVPSRPDGRPVAGRGGAVAGTTAGVARGEAPLRVSSRPRPARPEAAPVRERQRRDRRPLHDRYGSGSRPKVLRRPDAARIGVMATRKASRDLRVAIAGYLGAARGVRCRPEQIVLTGGTQQGLSLACRVLLDPGDTAWIEDPCYRSAYEILTMAQARIVPVPVDDEGLAIGRCPARRRRRGSSTRPRRGNIRSAWRCRSTRRVELLNGRSAPAPGSSRTITKASSSARPGCCRRCRGSTGPGGWSISARSASCCSRHCGSAMRSCPRIWSGRLTAARYLTDRQSTGLIQTILTDFMLGGHFARHLKRMRALYAERQQFLIACDRAPARRAVAGAIRPKAACT